MRSGSGDEGVRLRGTRWTERSILRLKRYLLEQYVQTLLHYPPFRNQLPVELNDTIERSLPIATASSEPVSGD